MIDTTALPRVIHTLTMTEPEPSRGSFDAPSQREHELQALSEAQLRQLYDEEEVERFLSLFSAVRPNYEWPGTTLKLFSVRDRSQTLHQ